MGLILCDGRAVSNPFYVKELGINIYSLEELCYLIVNYPYISLDDFADDKLIYFVNNELRIPVHGDNNDEIIFSILYCSDYYSYREIDNFKDVQSKLRQLTKHEFMSQKGDFLYRIEKYGKAEFYYKKALIEAEYQKAGPVFIGVLWKKIGCCRANLFHIESAYEAFKESYEYNKEDETLKYIYYLSKQQTRINLKQEYLLFLDDRVDDSWDIEFEDIIASAEKCREIDTFKQSLDTDSVRRKKVLLNELDNLKTGYRNML